MPSRNEQSPPARLHLKAVTKRFPGCLANDAVDLTIMPGEIHALLGENGAGKSTLVKMIYGLLEPDSGEILWQGQAVKIDSPVTARSMGVGMVFQHFSLFEALTVAENIALGLSDCKPDRALKDRIAAISKNYGLVLDPDRAVHTLSVGERQRVEIVRSLLQDPKLLIMDEPTSVLTPQETELLFQTLKRLAAEGRSVLYISHKLYEIRGLCHNATVLRGGKVVGGCDPSAETPKSLARMMIGEDLVPPKRGAGETSVEPLLVVNGVSVAGDDRFGTNLENIRFSVQAGEILGIAGVAGNGQSELQNLLSGEVRCAALEDLSIVGIPAGRFGPRQRRALGLAVVPEDRRGHGAVVEMDLAENALLSGFVPKSLLRRGLIRLRERDEFARDIVGRFAVKTSGIESQAGALSGGNLQKFIVGREILQAPRVLVAAQPTWGVDAGACAAIHQALLALAQTGAAILIISQDLDELFALCDRIAVLAGGRLSPPRNIAEVNAETLGLLMAGTEEENV